MMNFFDEEEGMGREWSEDQEPERFNEIPPREKHEDVPPPPPPQPPARPHAGALSGNPFGGPMGGAVPSPPEQPHPAAFEQAREVEILYANLLHKTDFEEDFIEDMLEFEPGEDSRERINELLTNARTDSEVPSSTTTTVFL